MRTTRLLKVHWDYSKTRIQPATERPRQREIEGIHWDNGTVMLKNCAVYSNMGEMEYTLKLGGNFHVEYTDDIEENRALLSEARFLLKAYRETLCMRFPGDNFGRDIVTNRLDQWLERAEKVSGTDDQETAQGAS